MWKRIFKKNQNIVYRIVAGEAILVPIAQNPDELGYIFSLNETSARIWELIDGKRTLLQVKEIIANEFEVGDEILSQDMFALTRQLEKSELIN